jgi:hypothetical protein
VSAPSSSFNAMIDALPCQRIPPQHQPPTLLVTVANVYSTTVALVEKSVCEWRLHHVCVPWRQGSACAGDREGAVQPSPAQPSPGLETTKLSMNGQLHLLAIAALQCTSSAERLLPSQQRAELQHVRHPGAQTSIFPCIRPRPHLATQSASSCQPRTSVPTQRRHDVAVAREPAEGQPR